MRIVLASSSRYRRELLARLHLPFEVRRPDVDETPRAGERPADLAERLSRAKARAVARELDGGLVIGSDQVALLGEEVLGKPGSRSRNVDQLLRASGRCVRFLTGVCVVDSTTGSEQADVVAFSVRFRSFTQDEARRYVELEDATDCAGGFRCEGLGVTLFEHMRGDDPTALVGLPLIRLAGMLREHGVNPLAGASGDVAGRPPP